MLSYPRAFRADQIKDLDLYGLVALAAFLETTDDAVCGMSVAVGLCWNL